MADKSLSTGYHPTALSLLERMYHRSLSLGHVGSGTRFKSCEKKIKSVRFVEPPKDRRDPSSCCQRRCRSWITLESVDHGSHPLVVCVVVCESLVTVFTSFWVLKNRDLVTLWFLCCLDTVCNKLSNFKFDLSRKEKK